MGQLAVILQRSDYKPEGVFGVLLDDAGGHICYTLEWSDEYNQPKVPNGTYVCVRGQFKRWGEKFEITGVPGHTAILFHPGNWEKDTEGCVLLGMGQADSDSVPGIDMVTRSKEAYARFMDMLTGVSSFTLEVRDA